MKKYLFIGAVILALGLLINYSLGGFEELEPKMVDVDNYVIYGTGFEGSYKSSRLSDLVDDMREHQQQLEFNTDLVIVNYMDEARETIGKIDNFVGLQPEISVDKTELRAFEKKIIKASKAIRIAVKIKPLVMPSPEKIKKIAFEFAQSNSVKLQNLSIEQYKESGVLIIEFPIEDSSIDEELSFIEKLGKAYGIDNFDKSNTWHYTFNVKKGDNEVTRAWTWHPASGEVMLIEQGDTVKFNNNNVSDEQKKVDHKFINDKYWLLFPFQLIWDSGYSFTLTENIEAPISKINLTRLTIKYNNSDGYTPGDAYDFYIDETMEIKEWVFRKSGQNEPSLITTWEGYKSIKGIRLSTDHYTEDGEFRLWFTGVDVN